MVIRAAPFLFFVQACPFAPFCLLVSLLMATLLDLDAAAVVGNR